LGDIHKSSLPNEFVGRVKVIWAVTTPDFSEGYIISSSLIITHHQPNLKDRWKMNCKQVRFHLFNGLNSNNAVEGKWADNFQFANPFILNCISWVYEYGYG